MADEEAGVPAPNPPKPTATTAASTTATNPRSTTTNNTFKLVKFQTRIFREA